MSVASSLTFVPPHVLVAAVTILAASCVASSPACGTTTVLTQAAGTETPTHVPRPPTWCNFGVGGDFGGEFVGFGVCVSRQRGERELLSARLLYLPPFWGGSDLLSDVGILYGIVWKRRLAVVSASAGLALTTIRLEWPGRGRFDVSRDVNSLEVGLPVEVQAFATPFSMLGIGIYGFVNANQTASFAGILLCLRAGRLR